MFGIGLKSLKRPLLLWGVMLGSASALAAQSLEDVLLEKGVISRQEWRRIKHSGAAEATLTNILIEKGILSRQDVKALKNAPVPTSATSRAEIGRVVAEELHRQVEKEFPVRVSWGKKGFKLETRDGNWATHLQWRAQMRYTYPTRSDPRTFSHFARDEESTFELRRVRMKIGGHGYRPWIKYYFEVDLQPTREHDDDSERASTRVIDWRISLEKYQWASLRVGQWKIDYNRERVDSSGKQQFVERSIVNRIFTIDRQMGAMLYGRLFAGTFADSRYYAGVFTGEGRGVKNDDDNMMYMARWQWNFLGRDLKWRQTDVEFHEKPAGSIAFAAATVKGRCTRWSSSGCGNLDGFTKPAVAENGQFHVQQMMEEVAFKWKGFSLQHEYHWKRVRDRINSQTASMWGSYSQAGYFFHHLIPAVPENLELAFRYAFVEEPIAGNLSEDQLRREYTAALNYFFAGHRNKVTVDYSHLTLEEENGGRDTQDNRVRVQWDVSF